MNALPCCADLSTCELARLFNISEKTARRWALRGEMGAYRTPGGSWRFRRDVVDAHFVGEHRP
jgi:excisionase family DNA binding protein